jgi:hypothetical protein
MFPEVVVILPVPANEIEPFPPVIDIPPPPLILNADDEELESVIVVNEGFNDVFTVNDGLDPVTEIFVPLAIIKPDTGLLFVIV